MTDLVTWLREQLDAVEREYRYGYQLGSDDPDDEHVRAECHLCGWESLSGLESYVEDYWHEHADQVHHRPQMLVDIDAKRRIVDLHSRRRHTNYAASTLAPTGFVTRAKMPDLWTCVVCCDDRCPTWEGGSDHQDPSNIACCRTIPLLALPYADRPGYREEWRP